MYTYTENWSIHEDWQSEEEFLQDISTMVSESFYQHYAESIQEYAIQIQIQIKDIQKCCRAF